MAFPEGEQFFDNRPNSQDEASQVFDLAIWLASRDMHKSRGLSHPYMDLLTTENAPDVEATHQVVMPIQNYRIIARANVHGNLTIEYEKRGIPTDEELEAMRGSVIASSLGLDLASETQARLLIDFLDVFERNMLRAEGPEFVTQEEMDECRDALLELIGYRIDEDADPDSTDIVTPETMKAFKERVESMIGDVSPVASGLYDKLLEPTVMHDNRQVEISYLGKAEQDGYDELVTITYTYDDRSDSDLPYIAELVRTGEGHVLFRRKRDKSYLEEIAEQAEMLSPEFFTSPSPEPQTDSERLLQQGFRFAQPHEVSEIHSILVESALA